MEEEGERAREEEGVFQEMRTEKKEANEWEGRRRRRLRRRRKEEECTVQESIDSVEISSAPESDGATFSIRNNISWFTFEQQSDESGTISLKLANVFHAFEPSEEYSTSAIVNTREN